jgi:osmotically-inducible protein OsmY
MQPGRLPRRAATLVATLVATLLAMLMLAGAGCQSYQDGQSRTYGEHLDDVAIRSAIKTRFIGAEQIRSLTIDTEVYKSVVTLTGTVPSEEARHQALAIARNVKGVVRVVDRLEVVTE